MPGCTIGNTEEKTMAYLNCPHCKAPNRQADRSCYSCSKPLRLEKTSDLENESLGTEASTLNGESSWAMLFVAVGLAISVGAGLGLAIEVSDIELPFFLEELGLGILCSVITTYAVGKLKEIREGLLFPKLLSAAAYGSLVGLCLFGVWWGLDPDAGFVVIGAIAGLCSGIPVAISFGLLGGEVRNLSWLEYANVLAGFILGFSLGILLGDFDYALGLGGAGGLIPCLAGGRVQALALLTAIAVNIGVGDDDY